MKGTLHNVTEEEFEAAWQDLVHNKGMTEGDALAILSAEWPLLTDRYFARRVEVLMSEIAEALDDD